MSGRFSSQSDDAFSSAIFGSICSKISAGSGRASAWKTGRIGPRSAGERRPDVQPRQITDRGRSGVQWRPNGKTLRQRLHRFLLPVPKLGPPINPALLKREKERAEARQNRVADAITTFSGSMLFVYLHVIWFGCWIGFGVEDYPYAS
jgi:hypothetical protein